jgi:hypothetical protein
MPLRCIIAGSRFLKDNHILYEAIASSGFTITEVVSGAARGADQMGEEWARSNGIPITRFPAEWEKYGKGAGHKRNAQMGEYAKQANGGLIAVWHEGSRGTSNMIKQAVKLGLKIHVHVFDPAAQTETKVSDARIQELNELLCVICKLPKDICRCKR